MGYLEAGSMAQVREILRARSGDPDISDDELLTILSDYRREHQADYSNYQPITVTPIKPGTIFPSEIPEE